MVHCTTLHYFDVHCAALRCAALHCTAVHCTAVPGTFTSTRPSTCTFMRVCTLKFTCTCTGTCVFPRRVAYNMPGSPIFRQVTVFSHNDNQLAVSRSYAQHGSSSSSSSSSGGGSGRLHIALRAGLLELVVAGGRSTDAGTTNLQVSKQCVSRDGKRTERRRNWDDAQWQHPSNLEHLREAQRCVQSRSAVLHLLRSENVTRLALAVVMARRKVVLQCSEKDWLKHAAICPILDLRHVDLAFPASSTLVTILAARMGLSN